MTDVDEIVNEAKMLVTAFVQGDREILASLAENPAMRLAMASASLTAAIIIVLADNTGQTPSDLWQSTLAIHALDQ